jgi:hypothetical protein
MTDLDALIDEADRTRKETIRCVCGEIYARDDETPEDHQFTDCPHCDLTYQMCQRACPRCGFTWSDDIEDDPAYGDHIDEQIDRMKEARREGH